LRYELRIAMRYLRARRTEAFISITTLLTAAGVMIGVAALTIVMAVMNGFEVNLRERVLSLTPQIQILSYDGAITDYADVAARANGVAGVTGSDPFLVGQAMVSSAHGISGVLIRGVEPDNPVVIGELGRYIDRGALKNLDRAYPSDPANPDAGPIAAIAIGATLADKLGLKPGDTAKLVAPLLSGAGGELTTKSALVEVGAIFDSGVSYIDKSMLFLSLPVAQSFLGREGRVDGVEVHLANLNDTVRVTADLSGLFPHPYRVRNWIEFNRAASAGFALLARLYSLVLLLLIGVAAFNLVATLIMVVMEKRKDVAVLLTMGATAGGVRLIFVMKGMIVGATGTIAGLTLGGLGCFLLSRYHFIRIPKETYGISTLPIAVAPLSFVVVALASLALCLMASLYPAYQASREVPTAILRG
jgi:lipoprotein-releasing system permease protein